MSYTPNQLINAADGGIVTLGAKADAAITNPASSASEIALLKGLLTLIAGTLATAPAAYPSGATPLTSSSGNVANASAVATLAGASSKTTYISGFVLTGTGATVGLPVTVTITGTISGTLHFTYAGIAGALLENTPLIVPFSKEIPASAVNTDIVVTCPALGTGNTNNTVVAFGYRV